MDCSKCDHYNRGRGQQLCLKCKKYKDFQIKSGKRQSVKTETNIPGVIIENIEDPRTRTLFTIIQQLPLQFAVPLMMRATLNASLQEIADYHNVTRPAIQQNIAKGIKIITKSLLDA